MEDWQLLPRPQRFTQLYFTNHRELPALIDGHSTQNVAFTVHNFEHQTTSYRYKLIIKSDDNHTEQTLGNGSFELTHGQSRTTNQPITVPPLSKRVMVKVYLEYDGIAFGSNKASLQTQSIHYWIAINQPSKPKRESL